MVVILFGKRLLKIDRFREYIRPFYEAIHAPYKTNRSYWFGLHQLFVVLVYVAETISGGHHVVILIFFILLLIYHILIAFQSSAMPFKSKILNMMNIVLLLNLNMTFLISEYLVFNGSMQTVVIFFAVANYPVIVISFFIIVYHILVTTNKLDNVILFCHRIGQRFTLCIQKQSSPEESNQCGVFLILVIILKLVNLSLNVLWTNLSIAWSTNECLFIVLKFFSLYVPYMHALYHCS